MRVQVASEQKPGSCEIKDCRFSLLLTSVNRFGVAIGENVSYTAWLCDECMKKHQEDMTFDVEPPKVDRRAPPDRRMQRTSRKRELEIAENVGGRRQPGSGNQPFAKGDVRKKGHLRLELKECFTKEFKIHREDLLDKIRSECSPGEQPVVVVTFRERITHEQLETWAILPYEQLEKYINAPR